MQVLRNVLNLKSTRCFGLMKKAVTKACFLGFLVVFVTTMSFAKSEVRLRYKVHEPSLTYQSTHREKITRVFVDESVEKISYTIVKKIEETTESVDDRIERSFLQLAGTLKYMGIAKVQATSYPSSTERIDSLGNELSFDGVSEPPAADRIRLVFPERRLAKGDKWLYVASPTDVFPGELETVYVVKAFRDYGDIPCVVLKSRTVYNKTHESNGVTLSIRSHGVIYFDYNKGVILNSVSSTTVKTSYLNESAKDGLKHLTQVTDAKYRLLK